MACLRRGGTLLRSSQCATKPANVEGLAALPCSHPGGWVGPDELANGCQRAVGVRQRAREQLEDVPAAREHLQQRMTDHSTRKGLKWGIVGGVVAGIFLPATIIGVAVALGVAGAAAGKARNLYHRVEVEKELADVITPGTSGILALVSAPTAAEIAQKMPEAQEVKTIPVDDETAGAIKAAAAAADAE